MRRRDPPTTKNIKPAIAKLDRAKKHCKTPTMHATPHVGHGRGG
jgi:hypothetical protein